MAAYEEKYGKVKK